MAEKINCNCASRTCLMPGDWTSALLAPVPVPYNGGCRIPPPDKSGEPESEPNKLGRPEAAAIIAGPPREFLIFY